MQKSIVIKYIDVYFKGLNIDSSHPKLLFRKSVVLTHQKDFSEAMDCLVRAKWCLEGKDDGIEKEIQRLDLLLKNDEKRKKALYARMLNVK